MQTILEASQTTGRAFRVTSTGVYEIMVSGWSATIRLQERIPDGTWVNKDTSEDDTTTWESSGSGNVSLSDLKTYRLSAASAGALATIVPSVFQLQWPAEVEDAD